MKELWKKIKHFFTVYDAIWTFPLFILVVIFVGMGGQLIFGESVGFYDPSIWQAVLITGAVLNVFNFFVWICLWFNFRSVFRYFNGKKLEDGTILNKSKDDGKSLTSWQRLKVSLFIVFFYFVSAVVIFTQITK